jgi:hypothetical protein
MWSATQALYAQFVEQAADTVCQAVTAVKGLTNLADVRAVLAYEESHKQRHGVVSAGQARIAHIAQEVIGIG